MPKSKDEAKLYNPSGIMCPKCPSLVDINPDGSHECSEHGIVT